MLRSSVAGGARLSKIKYLPLSVYPRTCGDHVALIVGPTPYLACMPEQLPPPGPNLLVAPLFATRFAADERVLPLPELLTILLAGPEPVLGFPRVAAEQHGFWYRFLVRCAAKALRELNLAIERVAGSPTADLQEKITEVLTRISGGEDAWMLFQPDPVKPGFLQPPVAGGTLPGAYKANGISLLSAAIGSKQHERKSEAVRSLDPEHTVYALLELQMGAIYGGSGNQASQLMGSGSGKGSGTPFMGIRIGVDLRDTFRHDVGVVLRGWDRVATQKGLSGRVWALWAEAWDGDKALQTRELDPAFIPCARLVRLAPPRTDGSFEMVYFRTSAARVNLKEHGKGGDLGDPFTPFVPDLKAPFGPKVRGTMDSGYNYEEVVNLLFGGNPKRPGTPSTSVSGAARRRLNPGIPVRVVFEGTAYDQGKTGGFHRRELLVPPQAAVSFADPEPLLAAHDFMLKKAKEAKSALRGAARVLLAGNPKPRTGDAGKVEAGARLLEERIEREYLPALFRAAEQQANDDDSYQRDWTQELSNWARTVHEQTAHTLPTSGGRQYQRRVDADAFLDRKLRTLRGERP